MDLMSLYPSQWLLLIKKMTITVPAWLFQSRSIRMATKKGTTVCMRLTRTAAPEAQPYDVKPGSLTTSTQATYVTRRVPASSRTG